MSIEKIKGKPAAAGGVLDAQANNIVKSTQLFCMR
jgi:hypothetical protein